MSGYVLLIIVVAIAVAMLVGLFYAPAHKCSFCNKNTASGQNEKGERICNSCAIAQRIAAEKVLPCPRSHSQLEKQVIEGDIIIDRCAVCHGVWFDAEELQKIREILKSQGQSSGFTNGLVVGLVLD